MSVSKKKAGQKVLKRRNSSIVVVIEREISAKDTLFPEKVARAKKILRNAEVLDPRFGK